MSKLIKLRNIKQALTIKPNINNSYELSGRVAAVRVYKNKNFVDLNDGSCNKHIQVVIEKNIIKHLHIGSYIRLNGNFVESRGPMQLLEVTTNKILFHGDCDTSELPFSFRKEEEKYVYRNHPHLRPRVSSYAALLRIKSEFELALHQIFRQMDFFKVHTPTLTSNDSEASSDLFKVERTTLKSPTTCDRVLKPNYFGKNVYLTTSAQLHLEMLVAGISRVYTIANSFRAENSETRRHLCEFPMIEAEEANVIELDMLMDRVETIIKFICMYLSEISGYKDDFRDLVESSAHEANFDKLCNKHYMRITYREAVDILNKLRTKLSSNGSDLYPQVKYGDDIGRPHERRLLDHSDNVPIFIMRYPKNLKPFYMKVDEKEEDDVECFDLIAPFGGEICGGSLREHSLEKLEDKLSKLGHDFNWYLESRRFGTFPHGGFGIGFDRLLQSMLGINNIRDVNLFPRSVNCCPM